MFEYIRADIRELTRQETGVLMKLGVILLNPGLHAVLLYRVSRWCYLHRMHPLAVLITYFSSVLTGAQISSRADIGKGLAIYHPHGIMIGATVVIGDYCILVHGNVIGQLYGAGDRPVIGNHFFAATGAKMLGRIRIGDKVRVGPNAVVTDTLPDGVTVGGNPARILRDRGSPNTQSIGQTVGQDASPDSHAAVLPRLVAVIARSVDVVTSADAIGEDTVLLGEGIGLDSLELLRVISEVEEEFGLTIDESELKTSHLQTVRSLSTFVEKQLSR